MKVDVAQAKMQELRALLEERWSPQVLDSTSYQFQHVSGQIPLVCYAEINPIMESFLFRSMILLPVELQHRSNVLDYINHVNVIIPVGNWTMDPQDGEVRWKAGIYFGPDELNEWHIRNVIDSSLHWIYQTLMGIIILQTGGTMERAIASIGQDYGRGIMEGMKQPG